MRLQTPSKREIEQGSRNGAQEQEQNTIASGLQLPGQNGSLLRGLGVEGASDGSSPGEAKSTEGEVREGGSILILGVGNNCQSEEEDDLGGEEEQETEASMRKGEGGHEAEAEAGEEPQEGGEEAMEEEAASPAMADDGESLMHRHGYGAGYDEREALAMAEARILQKIKKR